MMINSYQNKKALLVGNGVNLLDSSQSFSWGALLDELKREYSIDVDLDNVFKPFPLAFDEMLHQKPGINEFNRKIRTLKQRIRSSIDFQLEGKTGYNEYHQKIASLPYNDVLTTNYDYSLQKSFSNDFFSKKIKIATNRKESKFSLKRGYMFPGKIFWHIHGELYDSRTLSQHSKYYNEESIMIGYAHYTSYLERIQESIKGKSGSQEVENQSLLVRLRDEVTSPFWTDIFFTHNLDIIGQGFDFSENHLWWLINFRANTIRKRNPKQQVKINNRIRFFYPRINGRDQIELNNVNIDEIVTKQNSVHKNKAIAEVLKAFKVEPIQIKADTYKEFYNIFIERIKNES